MGCRLRKHIQGVIIVRNADDYLAGRTTYICAEMIHVDIGAGWSGAAGDVGHWDATCVTQFLFVGILSMLGTFSPVRLYRPSKSPGREPVHCPASIGQVLYI
mgnify:CR=1 FL=1